MRTPRAVVIIAYSLLAVNFIFPNAWEVEVAAGKVVLVLVVEQPADSGCGAMRPPSFR